MIFDYWSDLSNKVSNHVNIYDKNISQLEKRRSRRDKQKINQEIKVHKKELKDKFLDSTEVSFDRLPPDLTDKTTIWWWSKNFPRNDDARIEVYIPIVSQVEINEPGKVAEAIDLRPNFSTLPDAHWLGLQVKFQLQTPWYSRDDRVFHVLDNPVRKDRIFGIPFMAASSWKGMLRWACRVQAGLLEYLQQGKLFKDWQDPRWIVHLFGNEKEEEQNFRQGALVFYPTWFNRIDFEVINPHSRERRAGTQPIYYEVVPPGTTGTLNLLYAPWPGMEDANQIDRKEVLEYLLQAIEMLLQHYGISAKRTVGWGTARILQWKAYRKDSSPISDTLCVNFWSALQEWL
jgi:CRISPR-associated protein Cmr2